MLTYRTAETEEALINQEWPQTGKLNVCLTIKHHSWLHDMRCKGDGVCTAFRSLQMNKRNCCAEQLVKENARGLNTFREGRWSETQ